MEKIKKEEKITKTSMKEIFKKAPRAEVKVAEEKVVKSVARKTENAEPVIKKEEVVMESVMQSPFVEPAVQTSPEAMIDGTAKKSKIMKISLIAIIAVVILALGGSAYYFYHQYKKTAVVEANDIAGKVGKLMELPNEPATLATVTDKEKLKDQPFFAHSENGDKALIYTQAKKAILYRPSTNKIIEVMYLSITQNANSSAPTSDSSTQNPAPTQEQAQPTSVDNSTTQIPAVAEPVKAAVYNGTSTKGMAATVADKISVLDGVAIVAKTNAVGTYVNTTVVNLTGKDDMAQKIASVIGAQVTKDLPSGEKAPDADILVIAGSDFKK